VGLNEKIAEALGKIGGDKAVAILADMLQVNELRPGAALGLARAADSSGVAPLLIAIHDADPESVWRIVCALEKTPSIRVPDMILPLLKHDDARVRAFTARTVGKTVGALEIESSKAVKSLTPLLKDKQLNVTVNAARALGEIKNKDAVRPLGKTATRHASHHARRAAISALGNINSKKAKDSLIHGCSDRSPGVRTEAIKVLAKILEKKAEMFITMAMQDGTRAVRCAAIESYGIASIRSSVNDLTRLARKDGDPIIRAAAIRGLSHFDTETIQKILLEKLDDDDWVVVTETVTAIGEHDLKKYEKALIDTYKKRTSREDVNIRLAILRTLTRFETYDAIEISLKAVNDSDKRIRELSLSHLRSVNFGDPDMGSDRSFYNRDFDPSREETLSLPFGKKKATIRCSSGDITIELFGDDATQTAANFIALTRDGKYKDLTFHRVVPNFVVQGGCPRGDGWGDMDYYIRSEFNQHTYGTGYIGIAHDGKDTGGSQFFITHSPQHHLDGRYTIFGRVVKGMESVNKIDQGDKFRVTISENE